MDETLDPGDWEDMRRLGRRMVDDVVDYLSGIREHPVWRPVPSEVRDFFRSPMPAVPRSAEAVYQDFKEKILPYNKGNVHPRFFAFVQGTGTLMGVYAELLAASMNPNLAIGNHAAMYVEQQVIEWFREYLGFPEGSSGILLSGGSMANFTALAVARNQAVAGGVRTRGLHALEKPLVAYCSTETHNCNRKAIEALGIGSDHLRTIPVNTHYQMDMEALERQLALDRKEGFHPFCVIGNAGTVNTGTIDPLGDILSLCRRENMWFHVDGAFGALAAGVPWLQDALRPMAEADSLAFDLHKWMYMPYEAGCVLIRDQKAHRDAFALSPAYLQASKGGLADGPEPFSHFGLELSRGFKALKIWMSIQELGMEAYQKMIEKNCRQCLYLADRIRESPPLQLMAPVPMNIVCYRYQFPNPDTEQQNEKNSRLLLELQRQGIAAPSSTKLGEDFVIRVANVNQRSQREDFEILIRESLRIGADIARKS